MRPGPRVRAAADILDGFATESRLVADVALARWAKSNRYAGSKDRAAIADIVYAALRRWGSLGRAMGATGRGRALGALAVDGASVAEIAELCDGSRHAPAPLTPGERRALAALTGRDETAWREDARADWPDWLWDAFAASTDDAVAEAAAQQARAPLDLRVNTRRADRATAIAALADAGVVARDGPISPVALRADPVVGLSAKGPASAGLVEPQDAGSQVVALLAAPRSGEIALDFCAGAGGKSLAMAAAGVGRVLAFDIDAERLSALGPRAARAGARIETLTPRDLNHWTGACDRVLVDAPCSGSGTWRRKPDAKWRLTPARLAALGRAQDDALARAADHVRPGGELIYATCSLLHVENEARVAAFLTERSDFEPAALAPIWGAAGLLGPAPDGADIRLSPARTHTDGFFIARLMRRSARG